MHFPVEELGGQTLESGVHCFPSSAKLNGTLNLVGNGPWLLRIGSTLVTGATLPAFVTVNGLAADCNTLDLFWQVGSSATLGTTTNFSGNILALASITLNTSATSDGGLFARTGAVTLDSNVVSVVGSCGGSPHAHPTPPPGPTPTPTSSPRPRRPVPTLPEVAMWGLLGLLVASGVFLFHRR